MSAQSECLSYTVRRYFVDEFFTRRVESLRGRVLDLGGTKTRKRGRFDIEGRGLRVVYANLSASKGADVRADAARIPFADASFDGVVCGELLEHLRRPDAALREAWRVLRPGGILLATAPFLYRIHGDPEDYGRYTDHYWRRELADAGFDELEIERQGTFYAVLADFFKQYGGSEGRGRWTKRLARLAVPIFTRWALRKERSAGVAADEFLASFTTGFGIAARKPQSSDRTK